MKKKTLSLLLALLVLTTVMIAPVNAQEPIKIKVDGKYVESDVDPFILNDRTYVPARFVSETLGATVEWNTYAYGTPAVMMYPKDPDFLWLSVFPDKRAALVSEGVFRNDVPPIIKNDRTMLPVRFIASYFGCEVDWDDASRTVILTSTGDPKKFDIYSDKESTKKLSNWLMDSNHTTEQFLEILE